MREFLDRFTGNLSPSALLVSTFFWSYFDLVTFSTLLYTVAESAPKIDILVSALISGTICPFLLAFWKRARERSLDARVYGAIAVLCGTAGPLLAYQGLVVQNVALTIAGGFLSGVFQGAGVVTVGCLTVCQGKTNALIHMAACMPLNITFTLLGIFLKPQAAVALCALLPLLSAVSYKVFLERGDNARVILTTTHASAADSRLSGEPSRKHNFGNLALLVVVTFSLGFVECRSLVLNTRGLSSYTDSLPNLIRALCAALVFFEYVFRSRRPYTLLIAAVLFMASGLFLLGLGTSSNGILASVGGMLHYAGYALFDLIIWAMIIIAHKGECVSMRRFICIVYAFDQLGILLGVLCATPIVDHQALIVAYVGIGAVLLVVSFAVLNTHSAVQSGLAVVVMDDLGEKVERRQAERPAPVHAEAKSAVVAPQAVLVRDLSDVSARYFLTDKEFTVLEYLVAGRTAPYIAEQLTVSQNTVKTHIRHIYEKLDVHGRQELLDLCGRDERA